MKAEESISQSSRKIAAADHMLTSTYPALQDPALLGSIHKLIFKSIDIAMIAFLQKLVETKQIPIYYDSFQERFRVFKNAWLSSKRESSDIAFIAEQIEITEEQKKSPVEFARKDTYVICDQDYSITKLTVPMLKGCVSRAKKFIKKVEAMVHE